MRQVLAAAAAALVISFACGPQRTPSVPGSPAEGVQIAGLELIGEFNMPPLVEGDALLKARFGGVSGVAVDPSSGELLGVCDDNVDSRVFVMRVEPPEAAAAFRVRLHAYFPLPEGPGPPTTLDPEGIAITRGGRLFVASEGIGHREPRVPPAIIEYTRAYRHVGQLEVPEKFHPPAAGAATRGVRANAAFESLTLTPDERRLYTATETALVQDGEPATTEHGTLARMLEYRLEGERFVPAREFAYPVDRLARPAFVPGFAVTGLVELLALGGTEFLSMERGYAEEGIENGGRMNTIRLFQASIDGATDISGVDRLRGRGGIAAVRKRLLLDLGDLDGLSPEMAALDNFEGMAFGPTLPDGSRTLLIVSDDNFSDRQRTSFLLFRVRYSLSERVKKLWQRQHASQEHGRTGGTGGGPSRRPVAGEPRRARLSARGETTGGRRLASGAGRSRTAVCQSAPRSPVLPFSCRETALF